MKIASFQAKDGQNGYGVVEGDQILTPTPAFLAACPDLRAVLRQGRVAELIGVYTATVELDQVQLLPPIPNPERVFCVGINYPKRYPIDGKIVRPDHIILFAKLPGTLVGHRQPLEVPTGEAAETFDYEGEIAAVIGKAGRHISAADALDHVAGYTVVNDGSVRAWQKHSVHAGKNFANSGACGPWMVTSDDVTDPEAMRLTTRLNGEIVQDTTASEMFFSLPTVIAYLSQTIDLRPGDIIATGSPEGSGGSRQPQRFLRKGDVLDITVSGVGTLHSPVG